MDNGLEQIHGVEPSLTHWKTWGTIVALAMSFGLMEAAQLRLGSGVLGQPMPLQMAITRVLPYWLLFACLMPLLVIAARRFHLWRYVLRPTIPTFAATATCVALLVLAGRILVATLAPQQGSRIQATPLQLFQTYFVLDLLTFTALVGTLYAFHYYREARGRELTAVRLQASLAEARLKGLEAQVDPDFLFNTLNTISTLALKGQHKAVVDTLGRLSELLRAALSDERPEEIPLTRELDVLKTYVSLSALAPVRQLHIEYHVSSDVLAVLVPRLILPPLIELAAVEGLEAPGESRCITILAEKRNDLVLRLEIRDTAPWSRPGAALRETGIGSSTGSRLEELYGRAQSLEFVTAAEHGASVVMSIPFRQALAGEEVKLTAV